MINTQLDSTALNNSDDKNQMPQINDSPQQQQPNIEEQSNSSSSITDNPSSVGIDTASSASSACATNNDITASKNNKTNNVNTAAVETTKIADMKNEESLTNSSTIDEIQSNNSNSSTIKNLTTMCTSHESSDLSLMDSRSNGNEKRDNAALPTSPTSTVIETSNKANVSSSPGGTTLPPSSIVLSPCTSNEEDGGGGGSSGGCNGNSCTDDEFDEISALFDNKLFAIEKWLRERAPQDIVFKVHTATDSMRTPKSPKLRTSSVTSDLFQQWLASSPVQVKIHHIIHN